MKLASFLYQGKRSYGIVQADGTISVEYAACLDCGTCLAVAPPGVLEWHYPRGGFGVSYRGG